MNVESLSRLKSRPHDFRSCRYDKCINIGLLPYLVNSTHRKTHKSGAEDVKNDNSIGGGVIKHPVAKTSDIAMVAPYRKEKSIQLKVIVTPNMLETSKYINPENFQIDFALKKMGRIFDDIFFNFNSQVNHIKWVQIDNFCIEQIRQGKEIIQAHPEMWKMGFEIFYQLTHENLKSYLPDTEASVLKTITDNVILTLSGLEVCTMDIFPCSNLLEQWAKSCTHFNSDRLYQYYRATFPDIETLEPVEMNRFDFFVSPYAKSVEDETFITVTIQKMKHLFDNDDHLGKTSKMLSVCSTYVSISLWKTNTCIYRLYILMFFMTGKLFYILALLTPVNVALPDKEVGILKRFQQKISILIYSHIMSRWVFIFRCNRISSKLKTLLTRSHDMAIAEFIIIYAFFMK